MGVRSRIEPDYRIRIDRRTLTFTLAVMLLHIRANKDCHIPYLLHAFVYSINLSSHVIFSP